VGQISRRSLHGLVAVLALAFAAAGCGGSGAKRADPPTTTTGSSAAGEQVYAKAGCGSCHTLKAAGSTGTIGPNLDALKPTVAAVARQVRNGGGPMPSFKGKLSSKEIDELATFVAGTAQGGKAGGMPDSVAATYRPDHTTIAQCRTDARCYQQAFANLSYNQGPKVALTTFVHDMTTNPTVKGGCHLIAHGIGAGAYVRYHDSAGKAFVEAGNLAMACWSGYYHGILQRAFLGVPRARLAAAARRLCSDPAVHTTTFVYYQCVHGLGHGLMIVTGYDLPFALKVCDGLATHWDQTSCTGGVFMENLQTSLGVTSPYLKKGDPLYPCDTVGQRDKLYCYLMVTSHVLDVTGHDWKKTAAWCRKSDKGWTATCFQSFGRDASGQTEQNPKRIVSLCKLAGTMARECIYGASRDITSMDAGARRSSPFCSQVPAGIQAYCFNGIGTILGGFHTYANQRQAACRAAVPRRWWRDCYAGAGA
jgi:mono/diheme cytochrome c family protein